MIQNAAHLHLIVNHWPLILLPVAAAALAWGEWRGSGELRAFGFSLLIAAGLFCAVTFRSGEPAEEVVEHSAGVSEALIEEHEEAAEPAAGATVLAAVLGLAGLVFQVRKSSVPRAMVLVTLLAALAAMALMGRTANLGGKIRHDEIRGEMSGVMEGQPSEPGPAPASGAHGE